MTLAWPLSTPLSVSCWATTFVSSIRFRVVSITPKGKKHRGPAASQQRLQPYVLRYPGRLESPSGFRPGFGATLSIGSTKREQLALALGRGRPVRSARVTRSRGPSTTTCSRLKACGSASQPSPALATTVDGRLGPEQGRRGRPGETPARCGRRARRHRRSQRYAPASRRGRSSTVAWRGHVRGLRIEEASAVSGVAAGHGSPSCGDKPVSRPPPVRAASRRRPTAG